MWRQRSTWLAWLAWALLAAALVLACESEAPLATTSLEDAGVTADAEGEDAAAADASTKKDGGKTDAKADAKPPLGSCGGALPNEPCETDGAEGICCGGACVSPFDKEHCGTCSNACGADEGCSFTGACVGPTCKPGRTSCRTPGGTIGGCCDGTEACTDLQKNPAHCGQCGNACASGETCYSGSCVLSDCTGAPGGTWCATSAGVGGKCCGGVCTNPWTEALHCGGCGAACPVGTGCSNGKCVDSAGATLWCGSASAPACAAGKVCLATPGRCGEVACDGAAEEGSLCALSAGAAGACCGGGCADLRTDRNHCGACGNACAASEWCNAGYCTPKVTCTAADSNKVCNLPNDKGGLCCEGACIDANSTDNCGQCGWGCKLGTTCRADGGACIDATGTATICTSSAQCAAGRTCTGGRCMWATCAAGASGGKCAFGPATSADNGTCCNGECVDIAQDKDACGGCGKACASGLCAGRTCVPTASACPPGGCMGGQQCVEGTCVSACNGAPMTSFCAATGGGLGLCCPSMFSGVCEDIKNDANNCGGCGVRCPSGQTCQNGVCSGATGICSDSHQGAFCDLASGESKQCCGGGCVDVNVDTKNCGRCGRACAADESCVGGGCYLTSCQGVTSARACKVGGTTGVCCGGACTDTRTSESHCGQCNRGCGAGAECRASRCAVTACSSPTIGAPCFLAGDAVGRCCAAGSCIDVTTDENNCLGCGIKCAPGQVCNGGCQ